MKKKTKEQKKILREYKLFPLFYVIINEQKDRLLVMNRLTGEFRVLDK